MESNSLNFLSCCLDSKLLTKLADKASFYGNHFILNIIQQIKNEHMNSLMMENAIKSDSPDSVVVVSQMMRKNGITVTSAMKQTAQMRGVSKIIETLTGVPYDADHEKENVRLSILSGDDKTIAGKCC